MNINTCSKHFSMEITEDAKQHTAEFDNLPINWNK